MLFCFYYWIWIGKYRLERLSKMENLRVFKFNLLVPLFRPWLFRVVLFFYISIYGSSHRSCSVKMVFLKFRKFYRKTPVLESLFIKKRLQHRCFLVKFAKFLRTPILKNICERQTAFLIWNIAYEFTITLSLSSILRNSTSNFEVSFYVSFCEIDCIKA